MADVSAHEDVPLPAATVWATIGDFGGIRKWAVLVQGESVADSPQGKIRTLSMPEGRTVVERLVCESPFSYTYAMVDRPEMPGYRSTLAAIPLDPGTTRIALIVHMDTADEAAEAEVVARYTRNLRGNMRAMKKALGLAI